ncbi:MULTISPECIES: carbamoyl-phosphate synthase large subunit [unclassified Haematospirillum]|uniref:carbamoyl-phosphate synthase large subunit n=1 Tax=unclassified Haematospirillum TaxID=2622088 RepID=UPI001438889F|nr:MULTISPECIES: carbamoyl-phosphate synthase large subunit [unclassified Haematospirillum]NKD54506.1 carbamoyl-phosphate synthase large subunit [Haematospirillum sp. H4890]NKD74882.1 carbamoyl-phosphate synthase large subunit [Haematospirillum sp. H4485]
MPKRTDIHSILIIGAGPIVIGQACEFDYSGAQACKALREEGYRVILVNSNPATIMTDPDMADATYIEPITPAVVAQIIDREKPDALLPTMGGQTALNCALALADDGTLERHGVIMIGACREAIRKAEDRQLFREAMDRIGLESPRSRMVRSLDEAYDALAFIGLPAIVRPSFTLGGQGGGIATTREEFGHICTQGLAASPVHEILVEESVLGWKEYEMEVVRDRADNGIIVCSIENIDPMGIHTGDSVTVAPALTLTDKEYQTMRDASLAVLREIGVETGGSNVQFAVNPDDGRLVVIEMNPRVSRSSALASKATGFPIARIAAKLAVGYTLDELDNAITAGQTPASFEPVIDYIVTKIPRFTFEKFPDTDARLGTSMKSVGEVMAIGRTFTESLQKALQSLDTGLTGLDEIDITVNPDETRHDAMVRVLRTTSPNRIRFVAQAFREGMSIETVYEACHIDRWFLDQIAHLVHIEARIRQQGIPADQYGFLALKKMGFSDARLAHLNGQTEEEVTALRNTLGLHPVYKRIDSCAAEFSSPTAYMYACYEGDGVSAADCEAKPSTREKIIILGGGPNRIGQGIEFDCCCVHAAFSLSEAGYETIMVNCNPETVSTDPDTSDRLYFEPLTAESVIELIRVEQRRGHVKGVIVQFGGQTPLKLASALQQANIPVLGTSPAAIDRAEDRQQFQSVLQKLELRQPPNAIARTPEDVLEQATILGYPLVVRPSFVLGGRAMEIVHGESSLRTWLTKVCGGQNEGQGTITISSDMPILLDQYLRGATEVDVDAIRDSSGAVFIAGIMEHIEEAGIHSGDSACSLPPHSLQAPLIRELERQTTLLATELDVQGLINIQFAIQGTDVYVLEANPRASRTVPFVSKATGNPVACIAARVMAGENLAAFALRTTTPSHVAVKESVFPFARFPGTDILLGPEMKSTGEVMGIARSFGHAFAKSQMAAGLPLPLQGTIFLSVRDSDKTEALDIAKSFFAMGFDILATGGTATFLNKGGVPATAINKVREGQPHCVDAILCGTVDMVINTAEGMNSIRDSLDIRSAALTRSVTHYTTMAGARAAAQAIRSLQDKEPGITPLQHYSVPEVQNRVYFPA